MVGGDADDALFRAVADTHQQLDDGRLCKHITYGYVVCVFVQYVLH